MSQATRWTIAGLFFVAIFVNLATQQESWLLTQTSHGVIPAGQGAAYEMLDQLGLVAGRSYESERSLAEAATIWWIEPRGLCDGVGDAPLEKGDSGVWRTAEWISRGGTAVVFLPDRPLRCLNDGVFAGQAIPARALDAEWEADAEPDTALGNSDRAWRMDFERLADEPTDDDDDLGADDQRSIAESGPDIDDWELSVDESEPGIDAAELGAAQAEAGVDDARALGLMTLTGALLREPRTLAAMPLRYFPDPEDYEVLAASEPFGAFAIARPIGAGRLILVASAQPLRNESLREADAAPFIVDLAIALGVPWIDEREHGLLPRPSPIAYLVRSDALPAIVGVLVLAALWVWGARAELPPRLEPSEPMVPTLDAYVASVARLYRATRDHVAVLRAYQEFAVNQLRRSSRSPSDAQPQQIADRLRASGRLAPEQLARLFEGSACSKRSELLRATGEIDRIVEVALR